MEFLLKAKAFLERVLTANAKSNIEDLVHEAIAKAREKAHEVATEKNVPAFVADAIIEAFAENLHQAVDGFDGEDDYKA